MSNVIEFPKKNEALAKENEERIKNNVVDINVFKNRKAYNERLTIVKNMLSKINDIIQVIESSGQALSFFQDFNAVQQILKVMGDQRNLLLNEKVNYEKKLEEIQNQHPK
jgi:hypothetical protein